MRLEEDICFENDTDDHVEMLKALFVNHKVREFMEIAKIITKTI